MNTELHMLHTRALTVLHALPYTEEEMQLLEKAAMAIDWDKIAPMVEKLQSPATAEQAKNDMYDALGDTDAEHRGLCGVCGFAASMYGLAEKLYPLGVSKDVLLDTFCALHRMMREYEMQNHHIGFREGFWVWRQCCGQILRLSTLEFEYLPELSEREVALTGMKPHTPILSVHIPCGCDTSREALNASYAMARTYFAERPYLCYASGVAPQGIVCHTWLLSTALKTLLKETSGIRRFMEDYEIVHHEEEGKDCIHFLFRVASDTPFENLPEDTSLRRDVKAYLLSGKGIGTGYGVLKNG